VQLPYWFNRKFKKRELGPLWVREEHIEGPSSVQFVLTALRSLEKKLDMSHQDEGRFASERPSLSRYHNRSFTSLACSWA